jgi:two-component system response regulator ChvI
VDFIEKSRSFTILLRRIELILNGGKKIWTPDQEGTDGILTKDNLTLRFDSRRASWNQVSVDLTLTEFNIVACLAQNSERDISYRELYDIVHGEGFMAGDGDAGFRANVRAFVKRIRQKFRDVDPRFSSIKNYPGFGYRWLDGREQ